MRHRLVRDVAAHHDMPGRDHTTYICSIVDRPINTDHGNGNNNILAMGKCKWVVLDDDGGWQIVRD